MKKYIFIGIATLALVVVGLFLWLKNETTHNVNTVNPSTPLTPFGSDSPTQNSATSGGVAGIGGSTTGSTALFDVEKVKKVSTMYGKGNYEIANTDNYVLSYDDLDHSFNLAINKTPVGYSRKLGEEKLIEVLGIPKERMCELAVSVVAPYYIDPNGPYGYGLSFCPGSVVLPEMEKQ